MPSGKRKKIDLCKECKSSALPAISAAKLGHVQCLTVAYRDLGVFNERDDFGATPIHFAARNGQMECLVWLVTRSGISPNGASSNGATPAHDAAAMGHLDCLQYLLRNTRCSANDVTQEGATALHMACRFGRLKVVQWLMEFSGASPGVKGANDVTPVHLCAARDHLECLMWLVSHPQYVPNQQTVHGATPTYFAAQEGSIKCLVWLVEQGGGDTYLSAVDGMGPVHAAAQAGHIPCLQWLVEVGGVPIRHKAEDGATPAHFAAASGQVACLEWILDHGGLVSDRDNLGGTPVHDAAEQGQLDALSVLVDRGVDLSVEDFDGLKALDLAKENHHDSCAKLLFKALKPTLLLSLTPHGSLSRASGTAEQGETTVSGISPQTEDSVPEPVAAATDGILATDASAVPATGSARHSRHSSEMIPTKDSDHDNGDHDDTDLAYRPRPPISEDLFQMPVTPEPQDSTEINPESHDAASPVAKQPPIEQPAPKPDPPASAEGLKVIPKSKGHEPGGVRAKSPLPSQEPVPRRRVRKPGTKPPPNKGVKSPPNKDKARPRAKSPRPSKAKPNSSQTSQPQQQQQQQQPSLSSPLPPPPTQAGKARRVQSPPGRRLRVTSPANRGRVSSPDARKPRVKSPEGRKSRVRSPEASKSRVKSPDARKSRVKSPDARKSRVKSPEAKKRVRSPEARKSRLQSPEAKKRTKSPDTRKPRPQSPEVRKSRVQSPEARKPRVKSPDARKSRVKSPDARKSRVKSPDARKSRVKSPDARKSRVKSPDARKSRVKSPDARKSRVKSPAEPRKTRLQSPSGGARAKLPDALKKTESRSDQPAVVKVAGQRRVVRKPVRGAPTKPPPTGKKPLSPPPPHATKKKIEQKKSKAVKRKVSAKSPPPPATGAESGKPPKVPPARSNAKDEVKAGSEKQQPPPPLILPQETSQAALFENIANVMVENIIEQSVGVTVPPKALTGGGGGGEDTDGGVPVVTPHPPTPPAVHPDAPPPSREEKPAKEYHSRTSGFKEDVVITKPRSGASKQSQSSSTDEAVSVSFVTKASNVKKPFPVTHHKLMTEDDLSSPGSSDEEEGGGAPQDSFLSTVPGFEKLDSKTFEDFGKDMSEVAQYKEDRDKSFEQAGLAGDKGETPVRVKGQSEMIVEDVEVTGSDEVDTGEGGEGGEGVKAEPDIVSQDQQETETPPPEETTTQRADDASESVSLSADAPQDSSTPLTKWEDVHSLNAIDQLNGHTKPATGIKPDTATSFDDKTKLNSPPPPPKESGGSSSVLKMISKLQTGSGSRPAWPPVGGGGGGGGGKRGVKPWSRGTGVKAATSVTEKLKMFGDRVEKPQPSVNKEVKKTKVPSFLESESPADGGQEKEGGAESTETDSPGKRDADPQRASRIRSRTSLSSGSAFETIEEEREDIESKKESDDEVAPLPRIHPSLSRKHSQEKLRLDGLATEDGDKSAPNSPKLGSLRSSPPVAMTTKSSPPLSRSTVQQHSPPSPRTHQRLTAVTTSDDSSSMEGLPPSPSSPTTSDNRRLSSSAVYSPLMVSTNASPKADRPSGDARKSNRPVSVPTPPPQGSEALALFMNSANLPHLSHVRERHEREEKGRAEEVVAGLLEPPLCCEEDVPVVFRGLELERANAVFVWKQKAGSLHRVNATSAVTFDPKAVYIFLKVAARGPLLYRVHLWLGQAANDFATHSAYHHAHQLLRCLPGRPTLHREFQGYESFEFATAVGGATLSGHAHSHTHLNPSLSQTQLYGFDSAHSSFRPLPLLLVPETLKKANVPVILDTPTAVFLWLPVSYCKQDEKITPLEITELFITQRSYPKHTPVTIVTEGGETWQFCAHFEWWLDVRLKLSPQAERLRLGSEVNEPEINYPAIGQTKVWEVKESGLEQVPLQQFGHFHSSRAYLVLYTYNKQQTKQLLLETWVEGMAYVWVGEGVEGGRRVRVVERALALVESIATTPKIPVVISPEGQEPSQLLYLFKGKFVTHKQPPSSPSSNQTTRKDSQSAKTDGQTARKDSQTSLSEIPRLYRVTGCAAFRLKAEEVPASAKSLNSEHTFLLSGEGGGVVYVWAGQFAPLVLRRGALAIAKMLGESDPIKLTEGLETADFWVPLGGKSKHAHWSPHPLLAPPIPTLYQCSWETEPRCLAIRRLDGIARGNLQHDYCYVISHQQQLFIWLGQNWKYLSASDLIGSFISRYHSWKGVGQFAVMLVAEGNEGPIFWKWFNMQSSLSLELPDPVPDPSQPSLATVPDPSPSSTPSPPPQTSSQTVSQPLPPSTSDEDEGLGLDFKRVELRAPLPRETAPLTHSLEVAFDNLQQQFEDLAEEFSEAGVKPDPEAFRASHVVQDLSEMISGLDTIIENAVESGSREEEEEEEEGEEGGGGEGEEEEGGGEMDSLALTGHTPPDDLLTQSEDNLLDESSQAPKKKRWSKKPTPVSHAALSVMVDVGGERCQVKVREKAPVITVMFAVAKTTGTKLTTDSALFEVVDSLRIERCLEDHDLIGDVVSRWPSKSPPTLVMREHPAKNSLWGASPPISKRVLNACVKLGKPPNVSSQLLHSRSAAKVNWTSRTFSLQEKGIFATKESGELELSASLTSELYTLTSTKGRTIASPKHYCFAMKPVGSWKAKDMKLYCARDLAEMAQWIHSIRLIKHGSQLHTNFTAMKSRLEKHQISAK